MPTARAFIVPLPAALALPACMRMRPHYELEPIAGAPLRGVEDAAGESWF
jgi:hypothetical protein